MYFLILAVSPSVAHEQEQCCEQKNYTSDGGPSYDANSGSVREPSLLVMVIVRNGR